MELTVQLFKGEHAWNPDGTHALEADGRAVRKLKEDTEMTFSSSEIRNQALQAIMEHRARVTPPTVDVPPPALPPQTSVSEMQARVEQLQSLVTDLAARLASVSTEG